MLGLTKMPFITQGKTNIKYLLTIVLVAVIFGGGVLGYLNWWTNKQAAKLMEFPEIKFPEKAKDETAGWKTYRNEAYGFEIKYPVEFTFFPEGPNFAQQALNRDEQISGTVPPSFDVIIFSDKGNNQFSIEIYHPPFNKLNQDYVFGGECGSQFADENLLN